MRIEEIGALVKANLAFSQLNRSAETEFGVSVVQYQLLKIVKDRPGISFFSLAQEVGVHPSTLTQSIRRLARKKALFVGEHPNDSRKKIISLTRLGLSKIVEFENGILKLRSNMEKLGCSDD